MSIYSRNSLAMMVPFLPVNFKDDGSEKYSVGFIAYIFGQAAVKVDEGLYALVQPVGVYTPEECISFKEAIITYLCNLYSEASKDYLESFFFFLGSTGVGFSSMRFARCL